MCIFRLFAVPSPKICKMKKKLTIIKVGGKIVETPESLNRLIADFAHIEGLKMLVHGGGRSATKLAARLGIETQMVNGRRITDDDMLSVVTMVYGGLVNKQIVAKLQAAGVDAVGLTGADMNIVRSDRRPVVDVDYGWVGDDKRILHAGDVMVAEPNVQHGVKALTDVVLIDTFSPCREDYIPANDKENA